MKMKAIFLLLNAVLGIAFLVIFLTPLFMFGGDWFDVFWGKNWPIAVIFIVTLGGVDTYFLLNWRLFRSLEKEDWAGVAAHLEDQILRKGRIRSSSVRLLLNTYLVTSNTEGILALEAYLATKKPITIPRFSLAFGIPHLLASDPAEAEAYFHGLLGAARLADRAWVVWNHAFSLLQLKRQEDARGELAGLVSTVTEPVLLLLSLYLLDVLAKSDAKLEEQVAEKRRMLQKKCTPESIQKSIEKSGGNMQVVVLARLLQDAVQWLFAGTTAAPAAPRV
jgi:hypothetical protein